MVFDIAALIVVALSTIRGWSMGFTNDFLGTAVAIVGIVLAFLFGYPLGSVILNAAGYPSEQFAPIVGGLIIFIVAIFIGRFFINKVVKKVQEVELISADQLGGVAFGLVRGVALVLVLMTFLLDWLLKNGLHTDSFSYPYFEPFSMELFRMLRVAAQPEQPV